MSDCKNMIHLRIKDNFKNVYMYDGETKKSFFFVRFESSQISI